MKQANLIETCLLYWQCQFCLMYCSGGRIAGFIAKQSLEASGAISIWHQLAWLGRSGTIHGRHDKTEPQSVAQVEAGETFKCLMVYRVVSGNWSWRSKKSAVVVWQSSSLVGYLWLCSSRRVLAAAGANTLRHADQV